MNNKFELFEQDSLELDGIVNSNNHNVEPYYGEESMSQTTTQSNDNRVNKVDYATVNYGTTYTKDNTVYTAPNNDNMTIFENGMANKFDNNRSMPLGSNNTTAINFPILNSGCFQLNSNNNYTMWAAVRFLYINNQCFFVSFESNPLMCFVFQNLRIEMQLQRMKQRFMQSYNKTLKSRKLLQSLFAMPTNQSQKHTLKLNQKQNNNKKRKEKKHNKPHTGIDITLCGSDASNETDMQFVDKLTSELDVKSIESFDNSDRTSKNDGTTDNSTTEENENSVNNAYFVITNNQDEDNASLLSDMTKETQVKTFCNKHLTQDACSNSQHNNYGFCDVHEESLSSGDSKKASSNAKEEKNKFNNCDDIVDSSIQNMVVEHKAQCSKHYDAEQIQQTISDDTFDCSTIDTYSSIGNKYMKNENIRTMLENKQDMMSDGTLSFMTEHKQHVQVQENKQKSVNNIEQKPCGVEHVDDDSFCIASFGNMQDEEKFLQDDEEQMKASENLLQWSVVHADDESTKDIHAENNVIMQDEKLLQSYDESCDELLVTCGVSTNMFDEKERRHVHEENSNDIEKKLVCQSYDQACGDTSTDVFDKKETNCRDMNIKTATQQQPTKQPLKKRILLNAMNDCISQDNCKMRSYQDNQFDVESNKPNLLFQFQNSETPRKNNLHKQNTIEQFVQDRLTQHSDSFVHSPSVFFAEPVNFDEEEEPWMIDKSNHHHTVEQTKNISSHNENNILHTDEVEQNKQTDLKTRKSNDLCFNRNMFEEVFENEHGYNDRSRTEQTKPNDRITVSSKQEESTQHVRQLGSMLSTIDIFKFVEHMNGNMFCHENLYDSYNYDISDISIKSDGDVDMLSFDVQEKVQEEQQNGETEMYLQDTSLAKIKKKKRRRKKQLTSWTRNGAKCCSNKINGKFCKQCDIAKSGYLKYECWLCTIHTHQITVHHKPIHIQDTSNTVKDIKQSFLKCTGCQRHQCSKCVQLFFDFTKKLIAKEEPNNICPEIMLYLNEVDHFLKKVSQTEKRIIHDGDPMWMSCCHWSKHKLFKEQARDTMKEIWRFESTNKSVVHQRKHNAKKAKENHPNETTILNEQNLGGAFYADCWIAIKADVRFPMVKVLARESIKGSTGRGHAVISQEDAINYAIKNIRAVDAYTSATCPNELYRMKKQMIFDDILTTQQQVLQVLLIVLDTKYCNGPMQVECGTETLPDSIIPLLVYYGPDFFEDELQTGTDVVCFVCPPYLPHLNGDLVCSVYLAPKFQAPSQQDIAIQDSLWLRMWKENPPIERMERSRTGGPNGKARPDKSMFLLMNIPNSSPRQSSSCLWIPFGTLIIVVYISLEHKKRTLKCHAYSPVKPASKVKGFDLEEINDQARKRNNKTDKLLINTLMNFVHVKALAVPILETMNSYNLKDSNENGFIVSPEALNVQKMTNFMAEWYALQTSTKGNFKYKLLYCNYLCQTCCFTLLMYPTAYHYDNPGKRAFSDKKFVSFFKQNIMQAENWIQSGMTEQELDNVVTWFAKSKSFVENKQLFEFTTDLPLSGTWGRGGSDLQYKVGAIVDHTHRVGDFAWRGEPPTQRFLNALIRIGRELDVGNGNDEIVVIPE